VCGQYAGQAGSEPGAEHHRNPPFVGIVGESRDGDGLGQAVALRTTGTPAERADFTAAT
jgi:hypothetical protein